MGSFIQKKEALETCSYPEYFSHLQKERQIRQKIKLIYIFVKNRCRSH